MCDTVTVGGGTVGSELVETGLAACRVFSGAMARASTDSDERPGKRTTAHAEGSPLCLSGVFTPDLAMRNSTQGCPVHPQVSPFHKGHNYTCVLACRKWEEGCRGNVNPF